jgi:hypothetical protein
MWPFSRKQEIYQRVVDLGEIRPIRFAQYQQWHDVFISGPTKNVVGNVGNDFPGLYYYDPTTQIEHVIMFEGIIDWRVSQIERKVVQIKGDQENPRLVIGLFSEQPIDKTVQLHHWKQKRVLLGNIEKIHRDSMPSQWEALKTLSKESFNLLRLPSSQNPPDWSIIARECQSTLDKKRHYQESRDSRNLWLFFETFDSNVSTYDLEPAEVYAGTSELIAQSGLASSLFAYSELGIDNAEIYWKLGYELASSLHHFYDKKTGFFQNTFPPKGEEWSRGVIDTWYTFHNLYHILYASQFLPDKTLLNLACSAVDRVIRFVRICNYQIPLFAKLGPIIENNEVPDGSVIGYAMNPSVLGMYAMILTHTAKLLPSKQDEYLNEAALALKTLRRWPISQIFHQTIQLSWAAKACNKLDLKEWRDDFTRCLLLSCYRQGDIAGLFQGCSGLDYPAFRETVDAIVPWIEWLDNAPSDLPLRQIIDLVLNKAVRFIDKGANYGLPNEGLSTLEQPEANKTGIAIYAAPQVFDLARLQILLRTK